MSDLPIEADELYSSPPADFIRRRNELAKKLKATGEAQAAAKVAALSKPSLAAWALNQVARWNPRLVSELNTIDEKLRNIGSSQEFRKASSERSRIVGEIVQAASQVLQNNGHSAGGGVVQKLTQTLLAVGADEEARRTLVQGRLVKDLESGGFGDAAWQIDISAPDRSEAGAGDGEHPGTQSDAEGGAAAPAAPDAEARAAAAEQGRRRKALGQDIERLAKKLEERQRLAERRREEAARARREAEAAEAAAVRAEKEAGQTEAELAAMRAELARLEQISPG